MYSCRKVISWALFCVVAHVAWGTSSASPTSTNAKGPPRELTIDLSIFTTPTVVSIPRHVGSLTVLGSTPLSIQVMVSGNVHRILSSALAPNSSIEVMGHLRDALLGGSLNEVIIHGPFLGLGTVAGPLRALAILGPLTPVSNTWNITAPVDTFFIGGDVSQPINISANVGTLHISGNLTGSGTITVFAPARVGSIVIEKNFDGSLLIKTGATVNNIFVGGNFNGTVTVEPGGALRNLLGAGNDNGISPVTPTQSSAACVTNTAPVANAVSNSLTPTVGTPVTLDGSGSSDVDQASNTLGYSWSYAGGPSGVTFSPSSASQIVSFTPATAGTYNFELSVTDNCGFLDVTSASVTVAAVSVSVVPGFNSGPLIFVQEPFQDDFNDTEFRDRWSLFSESVAGFPSQGGGVLTLDTNVLLSATSTGLAGVTHNALFQASVFNAQAVILPGQLVGQGGFGIAWSKAVNRLPNKPGFGGGTELAINFTAPNFGIAILQAGGPSPLSAPISFNPSQPLTFRLDISLTAPSGVQGRIYQGALLLFDETISNFSFPIPYQFSFFVRKDDGGRTEVFLDGLTSSLTATGYLAKATPLRFQSTDYKSLLFSSPPNDIGALFIVGNTLESPPYLVMVDDTLVPLDGAGNINAALINLSGSRFTLYTSLSQQQVASFLPLDAFCNTVYTAQGFGSNYPFSLGGCP